MNPFKAYWIEYSNGDIVKGLRGNDLEKPEHKDRPGRTTINWGYENAWKQTK